MTNLKKVTKQEFDDFIESYPRMLEQNVVRICEPTISNFLDNSIKSDHKLGSIVHHMPM